MKELAVEAKIDNMNIVLNFINSNIGDCSQKTQNQIAIAADEIFSNIAHYAYRPVVGGVTVRLVIEHTESSNLLPQADKTAVIEFEDEGIAYDPLSKDDPDISLSAEKRNIGGLGIFMVKKIMDSVEYRRENGKNILTIKKHLL